MNPVLVDWLTLLLAPLGIVSLAVAFPARSRAIRNGTSAPRWSKIAQLAHAFLAIVAPTNTPATPHQTPSYLTCNEIQRLFITLIVQPVHDTAHRLGWSPLATPPPGRSQSSHYRRQAAQT